MFEENYRHFMDGISADEELVDKTLRKMKKMQKPAKGIHIMCRTAAAAAAVFLFLGVSIPVLAAKAPEVYGAVLKAAPGIAGFFTPVKKSCTDQGIHMEVESAYVEQDTAQIYVSIQDLEQRRLDDTADLFDSYYLLSPYGGAGGCSLVSFDEETGKAVFHIQMAQWENRPFVKEKMVFGMRQILTGKQSWEGEIAMDPGRIREEAEWIWAHSSGGNAGKLKEENGRIKALKPSEQALFSMTEGAEITAMGWVDGLFHVQVRLHDRMEKDPHGYFYLTDENGETVPSAGSVYFYEEEEERGQKDYVEHVFDITPEKLETCRLYGNFTGGGTMIEGNWQVTFAVE